MNKVPRLKIFDYSYSVVENLYDFGLMRVAACMPELHLGDPDINIKSIEAIAREAAEDGAVVACFPELALTGYSLDDLHRTRGIMEATEQALCELINKTQDLNLLIAVGTPIVNHDALFNAVVVMAGGRVLGVVPKTFLPNYSEFYETRQFSSGLARVHDIVSVAGQSVPFGTNQLFALNSCPGAVVGVDVCEDLWAPIPPSTLAALAGATVLLNLSASNASIGKANYRRSLVASQSARNLAAQVYVGMGPGDSTTDLAWDNHSLIAENGVILAESQRYVDGPQMVVSDIDLDLIRAERFRISTFRECRTQFRERIEQFSITYVDTPSKPRAIVRRSFPKNPYLPSNESDLRELVVEILEIQTTSLIKRVRSSAAASLVVGVSGGLDSTLALIVCIRAADRLGWSRSRILGFSLPGLGTSDRTRLNARSLMHALGVEAFEIDISEFSNMALSLIDHPVAKGAQRFDITFENVQAGSRTALLFRLANLHAGIVVGTGDLSEAALGWSTYGVGDHMSHYNVNTAVPKSLVKAIVSGYALDHCPDGELRRVLLDITRTPISPELIPSGNTSSDPVQLSEDVVGPFALQDFFLYFASRYGFSPRRLRYMARAAWGTEFTDERLDHWLHTFLVRFYSSSQFKRSATPNGPKVGNGGSLSPRGDWRAPSDLSVVGWLTNWRVSGKQSDGKDRE